MSGENQSGLGRGINAFGGSHHNGMGAGGHHKSGYHEPAEPFSTEFCVKLANVK